MPTPCSHFALLNQRVDRLTTKFVDDQIVDEQQNPLTFLPDLDRLAAYRLLVHAELEHFLEAKAKDHVDAAIARIGSQLVWMREHPGLLSLAIVVKKPPPKIEVSDTLRFNSYLKDLLSGVRKNISDNNGIKTNAFVFLSICAGKTLDEVDIVLSNGLNSYGTNRGDVAHKSVTHCRSIQAPSVERSNAQNLVSQLGSYFDVHP